MPRPRPNDYFIAEKILKINYTGLQLTNMQLSIQQLMKTIAAMLRESQETLLNQYPFQDSKLDVPFIYEAMRPKFKGNSQ